MKITENIELLNCDCMEYMRTLPDNAFDLAICDPPYGGGNDGELNGGGRFGGRFERYKSTTLSVVGSRGTITPPPHKRRKKGEPNIVGHRSVGRILQGIVQGITKSDYMGSELLQDATDKMLRCVA